MEIPIPNENIKKSKDSVDPTAATAFVLILPTK
jgi:hypothetical protein